MYQYHLEKHQTSQLTDMLNDVTLSTRLDDLSFLLLLDDKSPVSTYLLFYDALKCSSKFKAANPFSENVFLLVTFIKAKHAPAFPFRGLSNFRHCPFYVSDCKLGTEVMVAFGVPMVEMMHGNADVIEGRSVYFCYSTLQTGGQYIACKSWLESEIGSNGFQRKPRLPKERALDCITCL
ncbi:hypothetical protein Tco_0209659 [Tanacetum coccineum]